MKRPVPPSPPPNLDRFDIIVDPSVRHDPAVRVNLDSPQESPDRHTEGQDKKAGKGSKGEKNENRSYGLWLGGRYYILELLRTWFWGLYLRDGKISDLLSIIVLEMEI